MNERVSARRGGAVSARDAQDCKLCNSLTCGNVQPKRGGGFEKYRSGLFFLKIKFMFGQWLTVTRG